MAVFNPTEVREVNIVSQSYDEDFPQLWIMDSLFIHSFNWIIVIKNKFEVNKKQFLISHMIFLNNYIPNILKNKYIIIKARDFWVCILFNNYLKVI